MKTCEECEYHIEAGLKDVAFFYHICTYKLIHNTGKNRIICAKGEKPHIPDWCPREEKMCNSSAINVQKEDLNVN